MRHRLIERARDSGGPDGSTTEFEFSVVVDFVSLGGTLPATATLSSLVNFCTLHNCQPIAAARRCTNATANTSRADLTTAVRAAIARLSGQQISSEAPTEPILVRVVLTSQPCNAVMPAPGASTAPALAPCGLMGCVYSAPTLLQNIEGSIDLDLPSGGSRRCEPNVRACAAAFHL
jgi:hypothetical protein